MVNHIAFEFSSTFECLVMELYMLENCGTLLDSLMILSWYVGQVNLIGVASIWNIGICVNKLLCFRRILESRFCLMLDTDVNLQTFVLI